MNCFHATYKPAMGGFLAMVRLPRDGFHKPIMEKGGRPKLFDSALSAQIAASEAICAYLNDAMRRDGERLSPARCAADRLFKKRRAHA